LQNKHVRPPRVLTDGRPRPPCGRRPAGRAPCPGWGRGTGRAARTHDGTGEKRKTGVCVCVCVCTLLPSSACGLGRDVLRERWPAKQGVRDPCTHTHGARDTPQGGRDWGRLSLSLSHASSSLFTPQLGAEDELTWDDGTVNPEYCVDRWDDVGKVRERGNMEQGWLVNPKPTPSLTNSLPSQHVSIFPSVPSPPLAGRGPGRLWRGRPPRLPPGQAGRHPVHAAGLPLQQFGG